MSRKRNHRRRPLPVAADPISLAIHRATLMTVDQQQELMVPFHQAQADLVGGRGTREAWLHLADMCNLAEALAELRVGSNLVEDIQQAQMALGRVIQRGNAGQGWTLQADEAAALQEALVIYRAQIGLCSSGEHLQAIELVRRRIGAAVLAGRAGRIGPHVVHGLPIDSTSSQGATTA